jgi:hypothetical protein
VLFLGLKFGENLGFSLSEHCEWGTWFLSLLTFWLRETRQVCFLFVGFLVNLLDTFFF